jgi:ATP-binding cassette, sub-family E, member 1
MADRLTRIAIVSEDKCKPKKCRQECKKNCPVVKTGKFPSFPSTRFLSP